MSSTWRTSSMYRHRVPLGLVRFRRLEVEVEGFPRPVDPDRLDAQHHEVASARISQQAGVGPEPPHRVRAHGGRRRRRTRCSRSCPPRPLAGVDAVRRDRVGAHVDQRDEVLVRDVAVVALEEVVDDVLPVGPDVVGQSSGMCQLGDVRSPPGDLVLEIAGLPGQRERPRHRGSRRRNRRTPPPGPGPDRSRTSRSSTMFEVPRAARRRPLRP